MQRGFQNLAEVKTCLKDLARVSVTPHICGMSGFPTAANEHIPRNGGHYDSEEQSCEHKEGFDHIYELTDSVIRDHVDIT